jgi:hypothetical protein
MNHVEITKQFYQFALEFFYADNEKHEHWCQANAYFKLLNKFGVSKLELDSIRDAAKSKYGIK